jgi:tetratricopeptide (TPR) repeat protein
MEVAQTDISARFQDLDRYWSLKDPQGSESVLLALLLETPQLPEKDRYYLVELHCLIGRSQALQGKYSHAHTSLNQAEELLKEQTSAFPMSAQIRWLIERGRLHILEKTPSQARRLFSEAWTLAFNLGEDYFAVEIAQLMAATEPQKSQQEWIARGIEIAENSPFQKTKRWLGSLYSSLGWKLYDLRQYEKSLESFQKALRHLKAQGLDRESFVAQWSIGKLLRVLGKAEDALLIQKSLLAERGIGTEGAGRLYEELAECLQALKRTAEAQPYFELAYRELSKDDWETDDRPVELKRLKDFGKVK